MLWLYFARDFYRAGASTTSQIRIPSVAARQRVLGALLVTVVYRKWDVAAPLAADKQKRHPVSTAQGATCLSRLASEGVQAYSRWEEARGFTELSENFEMITGLSLSDCLGHDWIHCIHHDQQYAINEALLNATYGTDGQCLVQAQCAQGYWRWLLADIKAASPAHPYILVLWRDVSEQRALEETLKQVESALAISERGRSAFLSSMSHELRTPLNAIMGFSEMMKTGVFGGLDHPTYQQYVAHIHDSGKLLLQKVDDLLSIARMDTAESTVEDEQFALSDVLEEVIAIHSHTAFTRGQSLQIDCPYRLILQADRTKLICAVSHLIANALRHSQDAAEIALTIRANADDGVILSIRDTGEGIAPVQLELIRQALDAAVAYHHIEPGGIGLGLSLAKELAAQHQGRLMIDSIRHRGTVVSLILPPARVVEGMPQKRRVRSLSVVE